QADKRASPSFALSCMQLSSISSARYAAFCNIEYRGRVGSQFSHALYHAVGAAPPRATKSLQAVASDNQFPMSAWRDRKERAGVPLLSQTRLMCLRFSSYRSLAVAIFACDHCGP